MEYAFRFHPQPDITAYELAQIMAAMQVAVSVTAFNMMPREIQKHFTYAPVSNGIQVGR